jgi:hypothetical protein
MKSDQFSFVFWTNVFQDNLMIKQISTSARVFDLLSSSGIATGCSFLFDHLSHNVIYVPSSRLAFQVTIASADCIR